MMQPNRSTAAADEHRSSDARHQAMIFGSGHRLSREAYDDLSGPHALSGVTFFQALMHTALALEGATCGSPLRRISHRPAQPGGTTATLARLARARTPGAPGVPGRSGMVRGHAP